MPKRWDKGGRKLDKFMRNAKRVSRTRQPTVSVGFHDDIAARAIANEYGIPQHGIPERPFFRNAIMSARPKIKGAVVDLMRARGHRNVYQLTRADWLRLGKIMAAEIERSIMLLREPPNRPWKKGGTPLVFTGELARSIEIRVVP